MASRGYQLVERKIAEAEQVERLVERLLSVVIAFEQVLGGEATEAPCKSISGCSTSRRWLGGSFAVSHAGHAQHVETSTL